MTFWQCLITLAYGRLSGTEHLGKGNAGVESVYQALLLNRRDAFKTKGRLTASIVNLSSKVSSIFTRPDRSQMHSSTSFHPTKMLKIGTA